MNETSQGNMCQWLGDYEEQWNIFVKHTSPDICFFLHKILKLFCVLFFSVMCDTGQISN